MRIIYPLFLILYRFIIIVVSPFNPKAKLWMDGRKNWHVKLQKAVNEKPGKWVWFHAASLGEFEQGRPIIERLRTEYPHYRIALTFFSPSGYEIRKNYDQVDFVGYLPLDTSYNAKRFIRTLQPSLSIFIKYEFWPNFLHILQKDRINTVVVSAIFRPQQVFFKWYGGGMRKTLKGLDHIFVQNKASKDLLNGIGINKVSISGDTRYDRVLAIRDNDNTLDFMERFTSGQGCMVAGSTWPVDHDMLAQTIKQSSELKFVVAPHNMDLKQISAFRKQLDVPSVLYSERKQHDLAQFQVLIIDTIGLLTKVYSYAHYAYVGGGLGSSGLHNILEPATFGIPVCCGPNIQKFMEAVELHEEGGLKLINSAMSMLAFLADYPLHSEKYSAQCKEVAKFVEQRAGSVNMIFDYINSTLEPKKVS